ncbi:MAG: 4Fe-4S dicluster domain-containing protein [Anaerolineae bacterium]|nr:4Fe-4S dicluster domain-containing protein [Anaerolineae bacterium]
MKKIAKSNIPELLQKTMRKYTVYAPVRTEQDDTLFTRLSEASPSLDNILQAIDVNGSLPVIPPKDIFFPQQEDMFTFDKGNIIEHVEYSPKFIFGIKSCDLNGLLFTDAFFRRTYDDVYYHSRTQDRLIVTVGCLTPPNPQTCFCTSAKTGPFAGSGFDIQLVDIGESYVVEVNSENGQAYIDTNAQYFINVNNTETEKATQVKQQAVENVGLNVNFDKIIGMMHEDADFEGIYRRIAERCLYCGACLYVCPTCTCFNVFDDSNGEYGVRRRVWDGCVFAGYTRETSGHNPRKEKWVRTARRYEHKLKYDYMVTGQSGCIGCGRCLASCPVDIGMSKFIQEVTEN